MFGIGQFAQIAKVSVRTLRHYDDLGLLEPAEVDAASGYRYYRADQLPALNRILALKDLGFTLAEIARMNQAPPANEELAGMLRLRRTEAERAAEAERQRLARVAARLELLDADPAIDEIASSVVVKPLDGLCVATASAPAAGFDVDFAPIFEPLYRTLFAELRNADVPSTGPHCALYEERSDGRIDVVAAVPVPADIDAPGVRLRRLAPVERAATLVHTGDMANCGRSYQILQRWIEHAGQTPVGFSREVYLDCSGSRDRWVTELQFVLDTKG
jgi:DNA-binding transcriptional MerR regulator/effector-binding domain-containing protein